MVAPKKMKRLPTKKATVNLVPKMRKLKNVTKSGYIISRMEAVGALRNLIPEKIEKFASAPKHATRKNRGTMPLADISTDLTLPPARRNTPAIKAIKDEWMKRRPKGETCSRIFWSMLYATPHATAAPMTKR